MEDKKINPWFSILVKPRKTIRILIASVYKGNLFLTVFPLVLLAVFDVGLIANQLPYFFSSFLHIVFFIGFLLAAILLVLMVIHGCAHLLEWTGRWLGGQGKSEEIRLAIVWSYVPIIWSLFGFVFIFLLMKFLQLNSGYVFVFSLVASISGMWAFMIYLNCLGEVQQFSIQETLKNTGLPVLIIVGPTLVLVGAAFLGYHHGLGK